MSMTLYLTQISVVQYAPLKSSMGPGETPLRKCIDKLVELQQRFDYIEKMGVYKRPEDGGISVEYLNPSFFVKNLVEVFVCIRICETLLQASAINDA